MDADRAVPALLPLGAVYAFYFAAGGVTLPFLPAYFHHRGLRASEIGLLFAIQPALALVGPRLFCAVADRTGLHRQVLAFVAFAGAAGFSTLLLAHDLPSAAFGMASFAIFITSVIPLVDSLALEQVRELGVSFARLRLFGSLGFALSSLAAGLLLSPADSSMLVWPLLALLACALSSLGIRTRLAEPLPARAAAREPTSTRGPRLGWLLTASALHWIACTPFNGSLALHLEALRLPPWVVGAAAALGVFAEVLVMLLYPQLFARMSERTVLSLSLSVSAARWAGMSLVEHPALIIGLSLLHGLTFGAFYVAALGYLSRAVPVERRARGQGLFVSITFGAGGLIGYSASGIAFDALGGRGLFAAAALVALAATLATRLMPAATPSPDGRATPAW